MNWNRYSCNQTGLPCTHPLSVIDPACNGCSERYSGISEEIKTAHKRYQWAKIINRGQNTKVRASAKARALRDKHQIFGGK